MAYPKQLSAAQIIERIANANGLPPALMRERIEETIQKIWTEKTQIQANTPDWMLSEPSTDELVLLLEHQLYEIWMPKLDGWEWDGEGYRNLRRTR